MLIVYIGTSRAQWRESLWLRLCAQKWGRVQFRGWSLITALWWMRPIQAFQFLIPSKLEGKWGTAD